MVGLNSTLSLASQALSANSGALAITNNNIANVNTPGYSRQIVNLSAEALASNGTSQDNGVSLSGFTGVRDEVLGLGINQKTSDASSLNAQSTSWTQVESGFSSTTSGLGASLSNFFSAFSGLSTTPNDGPTRQAAFSAAGQLVAAFHQSAAALTDAATQADKTVAGTVAHINELSSEIAALNGQLSTLPPGQDGGSIQDGRDALTTQLAQLTGISSTSTESTPTLSTGNGSPLVIGDTAYALQVTRGTDGTTHIVDSQGKDITASLSGGSLGGALTMRDSSIPQLSATLNELASQFATAVNAAQAQGYDGTGSKGQPLLQLPANGTGAATGISLNIGDSSGIAVSADGSAGSSGNLVNLLAVQTQALPSGKTPSDTYANLVSTVGNASSAVSSSLSATNTALSQLTTQQASQSAVSVDEETTNLLRYQQAYTASAKVISIINNLYSTLLNMSNGA